MTGRHFNRRKIVTTAILGLGVLAGIGYLSVRLTQSATQSPPAAPKEPIPDRQVPPDDLTQQASQAYTLKRDVEQTFLPSVGHGGEIAALRTQLAALEASRQQDRDDHEAQLAQLRGEMTKKPSTTTVKAHAAVPDAEATRRRELAREHAKLEAAEEKAARESPLVMIDHAKDEAQAKPTHATSRYWLGAGTVVNCILESGINSEHRVPTVARVTSPVYDSATGRIIVIPQDAVLMGSYQGLAFGDDTLDITWERVRYDQTEIPLQGQPGGDRTGQAGLEGDIDHKVVTIITAVLTGSLFRGANAAMGAVGSGTEERIAGASASSALRQTEQQITRTLNVQPTVKVAQGTPCTLTLTAGLDLTPGGTP